MEKISKSLLGLINSAIWIKNHWISSVIAFGCAGYALFGNAKAGISWVQSNFQFLFILPEHIIWRWSFLVLPVAIIILASSLEHVRIAARANERAEFAQIATQQERRIRYALELVVIQNWIKSMESALKQFEAQFAHWDAGQRDCLPKERAPMLSPPAPVPALTLVQFTPPAAPIIGRANAQISNLVYDPSTPDNVEYRTTQRAAIAEVQTYISRSELEMNLQMRNLIQQGEIIENVIKKLYI